MSVGQDYENYLNNREAINALIAANPDLAFAGGLATFAESERARAQPYGRQRLPRRAGGLYRFLLNKAGLVNATVSRGAGNTVVVEI